MTTPPLLTAPPEARPEDRPLATEPSAPRPAPTGTSESLSRPFRLGVIGLGVAAGLFSRLAAANDFGGIEGRTLVVFAALSSGLVGLGMLMTAAERDRFGPSLFAMSGVTALAWGVVNWISPPFAESVTVWSEADQYALAGVGLGNGLLLAGIIALAGVRRRPTLTAGATMVAAVLVLAANSLAMYDEWPAIICLGVAFALVLLAWDRAPRRERLFVAPEAAPRISRAALSFVTVALAGTAIQLWLSRMSAPKSLPAIALAVCLIGAAFASLVRVRREIQQRQTTLSEWRSWMREIRTNDFRAELENFEPESAATEAPPRQLSFPNLVITDDAVLGDSPSGPDSGEVVLEFDDDDALAEDAQFDFARELAAIDAAERSETVVGATDGGSLPVPDPDPAAEADPAREQAETVRLVADAAPAVPPQPAGLGLVADVRSPSGAAAEAPAAAADVRPPTAAAAPPASAASPTPAGVFSTMSDRPDDPTTGGAGQATEPSAEVVDLETLALWLASPAAAARIKPLLVAVEAMTLDEYDSLPVNDAAMATDEIGSFLVDTMPDADLVAWIDGPYFITAFASKPDAELSALNRAVRKSLKPTDGVLALLRPSSDSTLDELVDEAVHGLLTARRVENKAMGR